jgi:hypothetical protein
MLPKAPRHRARFFFAQTQFLQLVRLEFEMHFDLRREITRFAFAPEIHLNPPGPRFPEPVRWPPPAAAIC